MKWIFEVLKYVAGYLYIAWKAFAFLIIGTLYFLWEFNRDAYKKTWAHIFDAFYTERGRAGNIQWTYETMDDFVKGEKTI